LGFERGVGRKAENAGLLDIDRMLHISCNNSLL